MNSTSGIIPVSGLDIIVALMLTFIFLRRGFATGSVVKYVLVNIKALLVILWGYVEGLCAGKRYCRGAGRGFDGTTNSCTCYYVTTSSYVRYPNKDDQNGASQYFIRP